MTLTSKMAATAALLVAVAMGGCASTSGEVTSGSRNGQPEPPAPTELVRRPAITITDAERAYDQSARPICEARVAEEIKMSGDIEPPPQRDLAAAFDSTTSGAVAWAKQRAEAVGEPPIVQQKLDEITKELNVAGDSPAAICWVLGDWPVADPYSAPNSWFVQLVLPDGRWYGLIATDAPLKPARPESEQPPLRP